MGVWVLALSALAARQTKFRQTPPDHVMHSGTSGNQIHPIQRSQCHLRNPTVVTHMCFQVLVDAVCKLPPQQVVQRDVNVQRHPPHELVTHPAPRTAQRGGQVRLAVGRVVWCEVCVCLMVGSSLLPHIESDI